MKIAYTTVAAPNDIHAWSGLNWHIKNGLINSGSDINTIGNLKSETIFSYIKGAYYGRIRRRTFFKVHDTGVMKNFAAQVGRALISIDCDVIFSPKWEPIAYLKTDKPIVFWHDATIPSLVGFYPGYQNTCKESIKNGIKAERMALEKCRLAIYSSDWAGQSAVAYYGVDPNKVKVVPFGANLICNRTLEDIVKIINNKDRKTLKLLFIGGEWSRKGGDTALQVVKDLNKRGVPAELDVVGCNPTIDLPDYVRVHGFISKNNNEGRIRLDDLFSQAHFFILPTKAEAFGVVFSEASSFGLPSLASDVGGVPSAIVNGKNGHTFSLVASSSDYCDYIEKYWNDWKAYQELCLSSFHEYSTRLNWETSGKKVVELIKEICSDH